MRKLFVFCLLFLAIFLAAPTYTVKGQRRITISTTNIDSYVSSLNTFRIALRDNKKVCNIPLLRANVIDKNRFIEISIASTNITIGLAIDLVNVYVLGYYTPNPSCSAYHYFSDPVAVRATQYVFKNPTQQKSLPFDGGYPDFEKYGANRRSLDLGLTSLNHLLPALYEYGCTGTKYIQTDVAKALVVAVQVVSEAARFRMIQIAVPNNHKPNAEVLSLQNSWSDLSEAVQRADCGNGRFKDKVTLNDEKGHPVDVWNISSKYVSGNLKLLLFVNTTFAALPSVVDNNGGHQNYATI
ncbi:ribosome-inactivating protein cucurmosin-like [Momordica charantia]|uniref:rRNA N-glycosylase n=1 Tax=Momordica charantia TaxID=3673 RepID=A0A6J1DW33_MOMCH|nr:ribosome-inactivating protein cucurmosin-like [Momordica charantia]